MMFMTIFPLLDMINGNILKLIL